MGCRIPCSLISNVQEKEKKRIFLFFLFLFLYFFYPLSSLHSLSLFDVSLTWRRNFPPFIFFLSPWQRITRSNFAPICWQMKTFAFDGKCRTTSQEPHPILTWTTLLKTRGNAIFDALSRREQLHVATGFTEDEIRGFLQMMQPYCVTVRQPLSKPLVSNPRACWMLRGWEIQKRVIEEKHPFPHSLLSSWD